MSPLRKVISPLNPPTQAVDKYLKYLLLSRVDSILEPLKLLFLIILFFVNISGHAQKTLYVSPDGNDSNTGTLDQPFKTIQKAIDAVVVSEAKAVLLKEGVYQLEEPLQLLPAHSSDDGLKISNYSKDKVVINGGREITGWRKNQNGWWETDIPEVKEGKWKFRQLYVNNNLRQRARKPNHGFLRVKGMPEGTPATVGYHTDCQTFEFAKGDISGEWKNLNDVEVIVYHFWTDSHLPILSVDTNTNIVTFKHKAGKVFTDDFSENGARYIIENVFEELDAPGEWYLDRKTGKCFYYPFPNEDIRQTKIFAPVSEQLIHFAGDALNQQLIKNIHFENLYFCYTNWELPEGNSNDHQGSASVPAAISLNGTQNCSFTQCRFTNLGTWAFELNEGCRDNFFSRNEIGYIAAGGFRINGGRYNEHPFLRTANNSISYNHIHNYGEGYPSAVGILLQHTEGNRVSHNLIHHGYYTGISIGWSWGYQRSISRDNIIEFNHIHHIGQGLLSDMGAIYTLGVSPGTIIRNNLIHEVDANHYGGWGIYNDEGSTHILVENNVVYNTKFAAFNIHFAKEITVRNNIFALGRLQQLNRTRMEPHKSLYFEQNIVYWREGILHDGEWNDEPYKFYYHPNNKSGRETNSTFDMDYNLYFNPENPLEEVKFGEGKKWEEWHEMGKDQHSLYTDPMFVDAENFDFRLKNESPAFKLGFNQIDIQKVGLENVKVGPQL